MKERAEVEKRSKLNTTCFIKWIKTRFLNENRNNNKYLYLPEELVKENSIQKIFIQFDADGSGGLSRQQVYDMFHSFDLPITMGDLNKLYDSVQAHLQQLDCKMFKKCALSEKSNRVFREIVRNFKGERYHPHSFINMIIYIVFLSKRQELRKALEKESEPIDSKVKKMENLLNLDDLSLNNDKLKTHTQVLKQNLRSQFRNIWQGVNQKYGQKFALTNKLQQQFYQFIIAKRKNQSL